MAGFFCGVIKIDGGDGKLFKLTNFYLRKSVINLIIKSTYKKRYYIATEYCSKIVCFYTIYFRNSYINLLVSNRFIILNCYYQTITENFP